MTPPCACGHPGDTLSAIAAALSVPGGWPALYAANRAAIGSRPGTIQPGTVLTIPGPQRPHRNPRIEYSCQLHAPAGWPME